MNLSKFSSSTPEHFSRMNSLVMNTRTMVIIAAFWEGARPLPVLGKSTSRPKACASSP